MFGGWILLEQVETDAADDAEASPNVKATRPADGWCCEEAGTQQAYHVADPATGINERCWRKNRNNNNNNNLLFCVKIWHDYRIVRLIIEKNVWKIIEKV